jgi:putative pyruvate formate lyase activating enzyme
MSDLDRLWVWQTAELADRLGWYRDVAANRMPAKFRIAATIPVEARLAEAPEDDLWQELDCLTPALLAARERVQCGELLEPFVARPSLLDLCSALARRMLAHCNFCQWNCRVDRSTGHKIGACKLGAATRVSTYFHHPGEEVVYRGVNGSGTIFFTSCNMRCAFCQNGDISTDKDNGQPVSALTLAAMAWQLRMEGCHNINWVGGDPTIHLHTIIEAIALLGRGLVEGLSDAAPAQRLKADWRGWYDLDRHQATYGGTFNAPMLWNANFFMTREAMKLLRLTMDVWLPDFKFGPGRCAMALAKTPWYWETVTGNLRLIHDWGEDFTIRHLVMPDHVECCTCPVLEWIAEHMPEVPVNVMDQYHPDNFCDPASAKYRPQYAAISRRASAGELAMAYDRARRLGLRFEVTSFEKRWGEDRGLRAVL